MQMKSILNRQVAVPTDHGSWVFLFSPLLIGLITSRAWSVAALWLAIAAVCAFLIRQPITTAVKVFSNRRSRQDLPAAYFWTLVYGLLGITMLAGLAWQGFAYLALLAIPGIPVFGWHLYLVSRRAERRQSGVEIVATGALSLAAPAAYWVGVGSPDTMGWWLFGLTWFQSAASIVYAYLRLEQRTYPTNQPSQTLLQKGWRALLYTGFNFGVVLLLGAAQVLPSWLFLPYLLQFAETVWGIYHPAIGVKPTLIGLRQLAVSSLFTVLFILAWFA
jgi:hypothetical protein